MTLKNQEYLHYVKAELAACRIPLEIIEEWSMLT